MSNNVQYCKRELKYILPIYDLISDCLNGEIAVKEHDGLNFTVDSNHNLYHRSSYKLRYLPQPNAEDTSLANLARYDAYIERAVFYNVTSRTLKGLVGQVFLREPVIEVPVILDPVIEDANGCGVSLEQLAKKVVGCVLAYGRAGLFVDYPVTDGLVSKARLDNGDIRPTVSYHLPHNIINWRTKIRGAKHILSLVVIKEKYCDYSDDFESEESHQYRVLRLVNEQSEKIDGVDFKDTANFKDIYTANSQDIYTANSQDIYTVEIWRYSKGKAGMSEKYYPKYASGEFLREIPFTFVGAENNDVEIDPAPLYDLASLNIAHYRNSADYEESCFMVGQPTPYFAGLTEDWVKTILKGTITLGSRGAIPLPEGGNAGLLQAAPNIMPKEAMEAKERQMVALGARLVEQKTVQRTATEAGLEATSENSTLASSAKNVSAAIEFTLKKCSEFIGGVSIDMDTIRFELNTDFDIAQMTSQERQQTVSEWQAGALSFEEMRAVLRKAGIATLDDKKAKNEIEIEMANEVDLEEKRNDQLGFNLSKEGI